MTKVRPDNRDEIDIISVIETLWDSKWKIVGITLSLVFFANIYQFSMPSKPVWISTFIKPIPFSTFKAAVTVSYN